MTVVKSAATNDASQSANQRAETGNPFFCATINNGRQLIQLGSNDYLALATDRRICAAATAAIARYGWGAAANPIVGGRTPLHAQLEQRLAQFLDADATLLYASGAAANFDVMSRRVEAGDAVFCDALSHVSILDAAKLSGAAVFPYRHLDCDHLKYLLTANRNHRRRLIASESLFGNDGSLAPLADLADLAEAHDAEIVVDEAHAIGTFGRHGAGAADTIAERDCLVARTGSLGKALGGVGGFVAAKRPFAQMLASQGRGYLHSTALPAAACAAALAALDIVRNEPFRRTELQERATSLRTALLKQGWNMHRSMSHIIPICIDELERAETITNSLKSAGYYLPLMKPAEDSAPAALLRLRINYGHEPRIIEEVISLMKNFAS